MQPLPVVLLSELPANNRLLSLGPCPSADLGLSFSTGGYPPANAVDRLHGTRHPGSADRLCRWPARAKRTSMAQPVGSHFKTPS